MVESRSSSCFRHCFFFKHLDIYNISLFSIKFFEALVDVIDVQNQNYWFNSCCNQRFFNLARNCNKFVLFSKLF